MCMYVLKKSYFIFQFTKDSMNAVKKIVDFGTLKKVKKQCTFLYYETLIGRFLI